MTETLSAILPDDLEADVHALLKSATSKSISFATAESCTGGLLSSVLTDVDGYGKAFERGFVVYTEDAKHDLLGVPRDLLASKGAVSKEVAIAMAKGALHRSAADIALSVTGLPDRAAQTPPLAWSILPSPGEGPPTRCIGPKSSPIPVAARSAWRRFASRPRCCVKRWKRRRNRSKPSEMGKATAANVGGCLAAPCPLQMSGGRGPRRISG